MEIKSQATDGMEIMTISHVINNVPKMIESALPLLDIETLVDRALDLPAIGRWMVTSLLLVVAEVPIMVIRQVEDMEWTVVEFEITGEVEVMDIENAVPWIAGTRARVHRIDIMFKKDQTRNGLIMMIPWVQIVSKVSEGYRSASIRLTVEQYWVELFL
jgi:hypothetical protein